MKVIYLKGFRVFHYNLGVHIGVHIGVQSLYMFYTRRFVISNKTYTRLLLNLRKNQ